MISEGDLMGRDEVERQALATWTIVARCQPARAAECQRRIDETYARIKRLAAAWRYADRMAAAEAEYTAATR
jgi:hypothetical protein